MPGVDLEPLFEQPRRDLAKHSPLNLVVGMARDFLVVLVFSPQAVLKRCCHCVKNVADRGAGGRVPDRTVQGQDLIEEVVHPAGAACDPDHVGGQLAGCPFYAVEVVLSGDFSFRPRQRDTEVQGFVGHEMILASAARQHAPTEP
jgi:hypothetical protein